jgi:hypothetical protein
LCLRKRCAMRVWWGAVAQLGERLVRNEEVSGSIPLSSTIRRDNLRELEIASAERNVLSRRSFLNKSNFPAPEA